MGPWLIFNLLLRDGDVWETENAKSPHVAKMAGASGPSGGVRLSWSMSYDLLGGGDRLQLDRILPLSLLMHRFCTNLVFEA